MLPLAAAQVAYSPGNTEKIHAEPFRLGLAPIRGDRCVHRIGRATALRLDARGAGVIATVRKEEDREALLDQGSGRLRVVMVDLLDAAGIARACDEVNELARETGLQGLVNNAGVSVPGPLEFQPLDDFRRQLDVNLTAQLDVTQRLLEALRAGKGRIVNVSSMGGYVASFMLGAYSASKFGMEAVSDALRRELLPWDIAVSVVQPGSIATEIWDRGLSEGSRALDAMSDRGKELYGSLGDRVIEETKATAARGIAPDAVAKTIEAALYARRPRTRYRVGLDAKLVYLLHRLLPEPALDALLGWMYGVRRGAAR